MTSLPLYILAEGEPITKFIGIAVVVVIWIVGLIAQAVKKQQEQAQRIAELRTRHEPRHAGRLILAQVRVLVRRIHREQEPEPMEILLERLLLCADRLVERLVRAPLDDAAQERHRRPRKIKLFLVHS